MWQDDGSGCVTCAEGSPEFVLEGKESGDAPVNARWTAPLASGQYFEITILEGGDGTFMGVATEEGFGKGYKCKGLFFGGNLSNGGALVRQAFGERFSKGMKIGVLVELDGELINVTYYQDGRCLGPAFASKRKTDKPVYPVVAARKTGDRFVISFPESAPEKRKREPKLGLPAHPAEGTWELKRLNVGPELGEYPLQAQMEGHPVTLKVEVEGPGSFKLGGQVVNRFFTSATAEADASLAPFEKLAVGPCGCTQMMGPDLMMQTERQILESLPEVKKWVVAEGQLLLNGPTVEMCFVPKSDDPEGLPATEVELP